MDQSSATSQTSFISVSELKLMFESQAAYQLFDCSFMVGLKEGFMGNRIPNAKFMEVSKFKDSEGPFANTFPNKENMRDWMTRSGCDKKDLVILYSQTPKDFGPFRVSYVLKSYGFPQVFILNGGLVAWKESGGEIVEGRDYDDSMFTPAEVEREDYKVVDFAELKSKIGSHGVKVIDFRSSD